MSVDKKGKNDVTERITEVELLRVNNAVLEIENRLLRLRDAERRRDTLLASILKDHGYTVDAKIRLSDGVIEGEKEISGDQS